MGIPEHLACLLRNLYAGQEARVRTGHGTTKEGDDRHDEDRWHDDAKGRDDGAKVAADTIADEGGGRDRD